MDERKKEKTIFSHDELSIELLDPTVNTLWNWFGQVTFAIVFAIEVKSFSRLDNDSS